MKPYQRCIAAAVPKYILPVVYTPFSNPVHHTKLEPLLKSANRVLIYNVLRERVVALNHAEYAAFKLLRGPGMNTVQQLLVVALSNPAYSF